MARPHDLSTRIFLDSGDPAETERALELLGFLDGQTTNPTLIARSPEAQDRLKKGAKFGEDEIYEFYRETVTRISGLIPDGSVSIEVYADEHTDEETMLGQSLEMDRWIPNAHIKFPITGAGLASAANVVKGGKRVNMTLCFSQEQAAAVHAATRGATKGQVFVSPFIGRLDDIGDNGMDLIANCLQMFRKEGSHVETLAASVRSFDHFMGAIAMEVDIITAPLTILERWVERGLPVPEDDFMYNEPELRNIGYKDVDLGRGWEEYDITHELTTRGIERFSADWNELIITE